MVNKNKAFVISAIYPPLMQKLEILQANCLARGVDYWLISGFRSWDEQNKLYALGRTVKNVDATEEKPMGGIVTKARGGQSYHNFGVAADAALDKDATRAGLQPDWNFEAYQVWAEEAKKLGLDAGYYWKGFPDAPHVQLNFAKVGLTLADLQRMYAKGGIQFVWNELSKFNW
jgi:peptidoglycan LD-endopeptidase CwlK